MDMKQIKKTCIDKDITLTKLSNKLGISRESMYYKIKNNDKKTLKAIEKILKINLQL